VIWKPEPSIPILQLQKALRESIYKILAIASEDESVSEEFNLDKIEQIYDPNAYNIVLTVSLHENNIVIFVT